MTLRRSWNRYLSKNVSRMICCLTTRTYWISSSEVIWVWQFLISNSKSLDVRYSTISHKVSQGWSIFSMRTSGRIGFSMHSILMKGYASHRIIHSGWRSSMLVSRGRNRESCKRERFQYNFKSNSWGRDWFTLNYVIRIYFVWFVCFVSPHYKAKEAF